MLPTICDLYPNFRIAINFSKKMYPRFTYLDGLRNLNVLFRPVDSQVQRDTRNTQRNAYR